MDKGLRRGERKRRGPKPKPITVVMSKYRRREANARERQRQGEINKGFELLRERVPHPTLSKGKCEKLRKIDVLHVAISYIRALENILESGEPGINDFANSLYSVVPQNMFSTQTDTSPRRTNSQSSYIKQEEQDVKPKISPPPTQGNLHGSDLEGWEKNKQSSETFKMEKSSGNLAKKRSSDITEENRQDNLQNKQMR